MSSGFELIFLHRHGFSFWGQRSPNSRYTLGKSARDTWPSELHKFARVNPVVDADLDLIKRRRAIKPPLNLKNFERAFSVLDQYERAWWRVHECLGLDGRGEPALENRSEL
jgi:hypothetical protein